MMHELDSQGQWQRLYERYDAMSDEELLQLAAEIDDLTELAADVLRQEIKSRRLNIPEAQSGPSGFDDAPSVSPKRLAELGGVELTTFYDALRAGPACDYLDAAGIAFEVQDVSTPPEEIRSAGRGSPVALRVVVAPEDFAKARQVLRSAMGLFPLPVAEGTDEAVDDGSLATAGTFARREDAEDAMRALDNARIWHRIVADPEGTAENEDCYILEVREVDLVRAGDSIASAMKLPEV